ncbi:MAG: carboxymuconolactone decarboxylase family protein [Ignavibacteria bacterium]|nr:carboxymuconolactone decarboxylase family protein [Ignavibacteria bacterium]
MNQNLYNAGINKLQEIDGAAGVEVFEKYKRFAPELMTMITEIVFGSLYQTTKLNKQEIELCVVAALASKGSLAPQLNVHIRAALHVGCTVQQIKDTVLLVSAYAGYPATLNAMRILLEITGTAEESLKECDRELGTIIQSGKDALAKLDPAQPTNLQDEYANFCPDILQTLFMTYGYLHELTNFDIRTRQLITIAALSALGNATPQLAFHTKAALANEVTVDEITTMIALLSAYIGFPAVLNSLKIIKGSMSEFSSQNDSNG